jgi:oligoendopeptidase F
VKRDVFYARVRRYENSLESSLDSDRIPVSVYYRLVEQSNEHLHVLHRYLRLRARMMDIEDMCYWDIYPPLVSGDGDYPVDRGKALVLEAMTPLGTEALEATEAGFAARWMDVYPRQGKKSGAYMNGHVYDVHPYVLMNYNDDYESVSTLAHEWGHALHSYFTNKTQHFVNADYSIFLAEVASTLNEALLLRRMLEESRTASERLFYLGHALEQLRGTFFRQAMFAEFELAIHERVESGNALTSDDFSELYGDLLRRYHGHSEGVVRIDDIFHMEWAYIPHFYYNFYVYQYATSVAAASFLAEQILGDQPGATAAYLDLLSAGGAGYPYDLLVEAGVDLARPEPYQALMRRMAGIMDEIEEILESGSA